MDSQPVVLGIDPGLSRMGFALVTSEGSRLIPLEGGTIVTSPSSPVAERLLELARQLEALIVKWSPSEVAVERIFLKANAKTAIPAIQASGVALVAAARAGIPTHEYSPAEVKQALVGSGAAEKQQVRYMIEKILRPSYSIDSADTADAHAVAVCHLNRRKLSMVAAR